MAIIKKSAIVPYTAKQMYDLVNDVESYSQFLPHCAAAKILSQDTDEMRATLVLSWGGMEKSFTTRNRLQENKMIEVRLEEGPLHHMEGFWRFDTLSDDASKVELDLEFEVSSGLLSKMFGPIFQQIASTFVDSFVKRAHEIYGN
jgi:ribosome-associated toxin RatA of RatAB toxin-antitoxin module